MTSWLVVLKYTGSFIAAFYGVYATLTEFRVLKDGRKVLSLRGYFGIGLLVFSSILALSSDGLKDLKERWEKAEAAKAELKARDEARARDERISGRLTDQLRGLEDLSTSLGDALNKLDTNAKTTTGISRNLGVQLQVTDNISHQLGGAVKSLNQTSQTANAVLGETVNRIDSLDVYMQVLVDPWEITDASGRSILSADSHKLLEDDKKGEIDLSDSDEGKPFMRDLLSHYTDVRKSVLSHWAVGILFDASHGTSGPASPLERMFGFKVPNMVTIEQGDSGVTSFSIVEVTSDAHTINEKHKGYKAIVCLVKYSIPPDRYIGIRRYQDLNDSLWTVSLVTNGDLQTLGGAMLAVGGGSILGDTINIGGKDIASDEKGEFLGKKKIPKNHFKAIKGS